MNKKLTAVVTGSVISEFARINKMFTAYDVTLELREMGYFAEHEFVRPLVHAIMALHPDVYVRVTEAVTESGIYAEVYKPVNMADVDYLQRGVQSGRFEAGHPNIQNASISTSDEDPAIEKVFNGLDVDARGRLCIPAEALRDCGYLVGDVVYVRECYETDPDSDVRVLDCGKSEFKYPSPLPVHEYVVDKDSNIRITASVIEKTGVAPYTIETFPASNNFDIYGTKKPQGVTIPAEDLRSLGLAPNGYVYGRTCGGYSKKVLEFTKLNPAQNETDEFPQHKLIVNADESVSISDKQLQKSGCDWMKSGIWKKNATNRWVLLYSPD